MSCCCPALLALARDGLSCLPPLYVCMCLHIVGQTRWQRNRFHTLLLHSRTTPRPSPFVTRDTQVLTGVTYRLVAVNRSSQLQLCMSFFDNDVASSNPVFLKRALWMQNCHLSIIGHHHAPA